MAESTLAAQLSDLQQRVTAFMGWPNPPTDSQMIAALREIVAEGIRQVVVPPPLQEGGPSYDWSFLHPTSTLDFPQNATAINLPDDFGGCEGPITIQTTATTAQPWRIEWRNEGQIRQMYAQAPQVTGPPMFASVSPLRNPGGQQGQRWELLIYPGADQDYTLQVQYYILPDYLTGATPYPYGGAAHASLYLESCLAIAEQYQDDAMSIHTIKFKERLAASIGQDRKNKPQKIGYNGDRSDRIEMNRGDTHIWAPAATYNGQQFS